MPKFDVNLVSECGSKQFVVHTDDDGFLPLSAVTGEYPGALDLKFLDTSVGRWRILYPVNGKIEAPSRGWGDREYTVRVPNSAVKPELAQKLTFRQLLKKDPVYRIDHPDEDVLHRIFSLLAARAQFCYEQQDPRECVYLYEAARSMPSTATLGVVAFQLHLSINGPLSDGQPNILHAIDLSAKKNVFIKLLRAYPRWNEAVSRQEAIESELRACRTLAELNVVGLVKCEVLTVSLSNGGKCYALKMRSYVSSLELRPQFPEKWIAEGFYRILGALREMHKHKLVHMDVKPSNIFVDDDLNWDLGDFGATREFGETVIECTATLNPYELFPGVTVVSPAMDLVLLCVAIAMEIEKKNWGKRLSPRPEDTRVDPQLVRQSFSTIQDTKFRSDVTDLFEENFKLVEEHIKK